MGVLLDKSPVDTTAVQDDGPKPFSLYLDKYKTVVAITSLKVSETDDAMLEVEFDHSIDAPLDEVNDEIGRVIIEKLEAGIATLGKSNLWVENEPPAEK